VAGLSLVQRNLMGLKKAGFTQVHVLCQEDQLSILRNHLASGDRRLPGLHIGPLSELRELTAGRVVVLDGRFVFHPRLFMEAATRDDVRYQDVDLRVVPKTPVQPDTVFESGRTEPIPEGTFAVGADTDSGRKQARRQVFRSLIKPTDGWFSVHLNRPVSMSISRILAKFPVHPNVVTLFSFLVGVASGIFSSLGTYFGFALGGVLFQLYSILDGVDGEIARVKFQGSKTGEWLDTLSDNFTNLFFLSGLTWGVYRALQSELLLWVGIAAVVLNVVSVSVVFWQLATKFGTGSLLGYQWEIKKPGKRKKASARLLLSLEPFMKRDCFSIVFMALALADAAWLVLLVSLAAMSIYLAVILSQTLRQAKPVVSG
jgi:phosphatidylglycerophosphate synthase